MISLTIDENTLTTTDTDLGLELDSPHTMYLTPFYTLNNVNIFTYIFDNAKKEVPILVNIDDSKLENILSQLDYQEKLTKNANFLINNYRLEITPEVDGFIFDKEEMKKELTESFLGGNSEFQVVLSKVSPHITQETLNEQYDYFQTLLNKNLTLVDPVYADNWDVKLINYPNWVIFDNNQEFFSGNSEKNNSIQLKINTEAFNEFVDAEISQWLDKPANPLKISLDEEGNIISEGEGNTGYRIKRDDFTSRLLEVVLSEDQSELTIPVEYLESNLEIQQEVQDMGIKDVLSIGHTSYYGSTSNRIHNIKVGAERFKGVLLEPGEEFSFNTILGPVNGATGYRKELVIKPEGTIPEYGGGLCQVSTTTYRAALLAGLDITNRREHSYAVSYYSQILGHGLDATIYLGGQDFEFINNTEAPIYIHTFVENDYELYFIFLGTSDGRSVELEGPVISGYRSPGPTQYIETDTLKEGETKQVEKSHNGFSVLWKRHITDADGNVTTEDITTNYKAVPSKILVGTGSNEN